MVALIIGVGAGIVGTLVAGFLYLCSKWGHR